MAPWVALLVVTLSLFASFPSFVGAQTCERWNGKPSYCGEFEAWQGFDTHIFVPKNKTLEELQTAVAYAINLVGALGYDGSLPSRCNHMWARLNCGTHLRPCALVPTSEDDVIEYIAAPIQTCHSTCLDYLWFLTNGNKVTTCTEYVESQGLEVGASVYFPPGFTAPLTCEEVDTNGAALYQSLSYNSSSFASGSNTETYKLQCNDLPANGTYLVCEPPLTNVEDTNNCGFVCPLPAYTEEDYDSLKTLQLVLGWMSWTGSLVVVLSYGLHNKLRQFPSNLILMAAVAAHAESVGMILPTFFGYHNTWCGFDTTYLMPESDLANQQLTLYFPSTLILRIYRCIQGCAHSKDGWCRWDSCPAPCGGASLPSTCFSLYVIHLII
ncbi:hypothetical protein QOT17_013612 [Balamuthia mandrillaris]